MAEKVDESVEGGAMEPEPEMNESVEANKVTHRQAHRQTHRDRHASKGHGCGAASILLLRPALSI